MDYNIILLLTLGILLFLTLLVVAGLTLSARAFTTLTGLIRDLFLQAIQAVEHIPSAPTASLPKQESDTQSQGREITLSERDK